MMKFRIASNCAALALAAPLAAQDRLAVALAQYQHEADPVRKARDLSKFGDDQVEEAKKQLKTGKMSLLFTPSRSIGTKFRKPLPALEAGGADAEKKPAGFKELQISLRETVRHIDDLILTLPVDKRPFFREVRNDLVKAQNELIDALFPRKPNQSPKKTNP